MLLILVFPSSFAPENISLRSCAMWYCIWCDIRFPFMGIEFRVTTVNRCFIVHIEYVKMLKSKQTDTISVFRRMSSSIAHHILWCLISDFSQSLFQSYAYLNQKHHFSEAKIIRTNKTWKMKSLPSASHVRNSELHNIITSNNRIVYHICTTCLLRGSSWIRGSRSIRYKIVAQLKSKNDITKQASSSQNSSWTRVQTESNIDKNHFSAHTWWARAQPKKQKDEELNFFSFIGAANQHIRNRIRQLLYFEFI